MPFHGTWTEYLPPYNGPTEPDEIDDDKPSGPVLPKPNVKALPLTAAMVAAGWRHIDTAPEDESVILATAGGWIGEAWMLRSEDTGEQEWFWHGLDEGRFGRRADTHFRLLGWMPMPAHPAPTMENE